jgi:gliding motility-associated-like protein
VGVKSLYKAVGKSGSTYNYDVPIGGRLLQQYTDSIVVEWGFQRGMFALGVQEVTLQGCEGNWAFLNVAVIGAEIQFSQNAYMLCTESGVEVAFNESDFQTYQWVGQNGQSVKNNIITQPGIYELQAFDYNNCLISKSVTVTPPPVVNLGNDTMICTPGFRLFARKNGINPEGTLYTWSTGENGETPYLDVYDHPTDKDAFYWVRADLNNCSVTDTVVVLACAVDKTEMEIWEIPNTFTPNGDGDNDVWQIRKLKDYPNAVVEVFDRWGRRVFLSQRGYPTPWDGRDTDGKILPLEAYYYVIGLNDGVHTKSIVGTITIVR